MAARLTLFAFALWLALVDFYSNFANANLTVRPTDTVVLVNQATYFNCSTSDRNINAKFVLWYHYPVNSPTRNDVYDEGVIMFEYKDRFRIETDLAAGVFNLVAERPSLADAGRYECQDGVGQGDKASAELIVLDGNPSCKSNMNPEGVIGQIDCDLEPDDIQLTCNVASFRGNIPPSLEWKISSDESNSSLVVCQPSTSCNRTLKSNLTLNSQSLVCQTTKARRQQYGCSIGSIKVTYALSSRVTTVTTERNVLCSTNNSQHCTYKWRNDKDEEISLNEDMGKQQPGDYKCEAECKMKRRNESCRFIAMEVHVEHPDHSAVYANVFPILLILLILVICIVLGCYFYKRRRRRKKLKKSDPNRLTTPLTSANTENGANEQVNLNDNEPNNGRKGIVSVHAKANLNSPTVDLLYIEEGIVYRLNTDTLKDKSAFMRDICSLLVKYGFYRADVEKSIVFFFQCQNLAQLKRLQNLLATKELQKKIESIYIEFLPTSTIVGVEVTWDDAEFKKAESTLQDAVDSTPLVPSGELSSSLPIITDQDMVDKLTVNKYFIDRGTTAAIYGPFMWKGKKCAIKQILYSPDKLTEERKEEIMRVRDRCMGLNHPHLVKVFEMWFPSPALYILMEYAEGKSLDKILRPKDAPTPLEPFSFVIVQDWALQIADGMKYLHENKLVHRNLKAAHVLVMESADVLPNTLKIGSYTLTKEHDHSTVMSLKGTMAWMAPEYIRGEPFSVLSDVWSYGVTVWEILTRDVPYKEIRKETDLVRGAINKTLALKIPESCPERLRTLLTDCWKYEVNERPSFREICDCLRTTD